MSYLAQTFLFVFGLAVGSFLNVLAMRYGLRERLLTASVVSGRSCCRSCGKTLRWYELVPLLSFLVQGGKCRTCGARLSLQYPVIELLSGFIFLGIPGRIRDVFQIWPLGETGALPSWYYPFVAFWMVALATLILVALIDLRLFIIPDQLNLLILIAGLLTLGGQFLYQKFGFITGSFLKHNALLFGFRDNIWFNHALAAFIGVFLFSLIVVLSRGRAMGMGDVKLIGALGILFGWPDVLLIIFFSFVLGSIVGLYLMAKKKKTLKDVVPFGPFIVLGALVVFFLGSEILEGYFNLFGIL